jgi:orotidine-5'-phosphate decarboxylase
MNQLDKTIVALDQMSEEEINYFLKSTDHQIKTVKIGLELFSKYGPSIITSIANNHQVKIFLDLKLHDIPTTVQMTLRSFKGLPIAFLTVHLGGGEDMLKMAMEEIKISLPHTKILGVSFLTCLSQNDLKNIYGIRNTDLAFKRLFKLAAIAKLDGVICSPLEIKLLKEMDSKLLAVTPGIRFSDEHKATDQKRIATPNKAFKLGADYIVIGRSLTKASDLVQRIRELQVPL